MSRGLALLLAGALACPCAAAQTTPADGIGPLLERLQTALQTGQRDAFVALVAPESRSDDLESFTADLFDTSIQRAVILERDRAPLSGALPGDGFRLVVELFTETSTRARIVTALFDVRRPSGGAPETWHITAARTVSAVDGLFRLRLDTARQYAGRNLTITAEDVVITLTEGAVFPIESEVGVTGLVLLGQGLMRFSPEPPTERGQLRIFAGADTLQSQFDSALVRLNPADYDRRVTLDRLTPAPLNPRDVRRARDVFARDLPKSFSLDLTELSSEPWYLLPPPGDLLAEVRTRRHGNLTYSRSATQAEDITLFDRERRRTIALYPSRQRRATYGLSFNEDERREYDVLDYDIEASLRPESGQLEGRARMRVRARSDGLSALTLRLANELAVRGIASTEHGRLLHLRVRDQDNVIVNLPTSLAANEELTLVVSYAGRLEPQDIEDEGLQQTGEAPREEPLFIPAEPNFLLSSRSFWYPQNPVTDYATGTLRIIVPEGYGCVASGELRTGTEVTLRDLLTIARGKSFVFTARDPLRYFALVVSKFTRVAETTINLADDAGAEGGAPVQIAIDANPRQQSRGRAVIGDVETMMQYYAGLVGDAPYASMTVALVEHELPGGHSPGYFVVLNNTLPRSRTTWRNDPAAFAGFPEFFLAHELAHQWWGQAVGWRNYHDQWLSEGFAQYFAALYAQHSRGERTFVEMLRQFRRWAIAESDEGPISLGSRLGHIREEPRVFRALVYNKGAAVLHMLRRLLGDELFFRSLRQFYADQKFRKAGTEDLRAVFEAEAGRSLERFFDRWIYSAAIPSLRYTTAAAAGAVTVRFEQVGDDVFDVPVTVTVVYADGRVEDTVVPVTDRQVERQIPTKGVVKQVQINRDFAAVAVFERIGG